MQWRQITAVFEEPAVADDCLTSGEGSLGQGSPGSKPELLSVGVRMRALAPLYRFLLRFDPDAAVVVTEVWQLFEPGQCSFWSSGHSLWSLARWTQPLDLSFWSSGHSLWSQAWWTQPLDLSRGAEERGLWSIAQVDICLEIWNR